MAALLAVSARDGAWAREGAGLLLAPRPHRRRPADRRRGGAAGAASGIETASAERTRR
jgi:hypothetical protein